MSRPVRRRAAALALVALAAAGLDACAFARRVPALRYYTLAPPGTPAAALAAPVRVHVFTADQPYASERLAYRTSPYRLDYYTYHRWAADPRRMLATATRDYLEQAAPARGAAALEIAGHVRRLEEIDHGGTREGALALDLRVTRGGATLLERSYAEREPAEAANPEAVVAALSRALGRILDQVAGALATPEAPGGD